MGECKRGNPTAEERESRRFNTGTPILDEFLKLIWQHGIAFVSEETGICRSTIDKWISGDTVPSLAKAQKVLNAIDHEFVIFEIDEPFEEE